MNLQKIYFSTLLRFKISNARIISHHFFTVVIWITWSQSMWLLPVGLSERCCVQYSACTLNWIGSMHCATYSECDPRAGCANLKSAWLKSLLFYFFFKSMIQIKIKIFGEYVVLCVLKHNKTWPICHLHQYLPPPPPHTYIGFRHLYWRRLLRRSQNTKTYITLNHSNSTQHSFLSFAHSNYFIETKQNWKR